MDKGHNKREIHSLTRFNEYKDFIKDKQVEFVVKKTERVVCVVYMLSNFIPHFETLHGDLKRTTHALLEGVSSFPQLDGLSTSVVEKVHSKLQYLSSLLSLAFISGYISESNIEILKSEINYLHRHIEDLATKSSSERGQLQVKSNLFVVNQSSHIPQNSMVNTPNKKAVIKDNYAKSESKTQTKSNIKDISRTKSSATESRSSTSSDTKEEREEKVISVIRDKGTVTIKDISSVIFDVSEKTIQRALQGMIDKGQIKKEGERRWAKYSLV